MRQIIRIAIICAISFIGLKVHAQNYTLTGHVTDSEGNILPGVGINVKGSTIGTTTNSNGEYELQWNNMQQPVIVFSFVGMQTQEIKYIGQQVLDVVLKDNVQLLQEVVVTGLQRIERGRATGSFTILNDKEMKSIYSNNVIDKLVGTTPGLYIDKNSNISIRGISTLNANAKPLIVVDGFPMESSTLNVNPEDIEQITVLKDAASAAIWGIRAANGVIVITTKRGTKNKKMEVSYSTTLTSAEKVHLSDLNILSSDQYTRLLFEDYQNDVPYTSGTYGGEFNELESIFMKWYDTGELSYQEAIAQVNELGKFSNRKQIEDNFYRRAFTQQHTISMQAGGENISVYSSLNFDENKTRLVGNDYKKVNLMLNTDFHLTKKLKVKLDVRATDKWENRNGSSSVLDYEPWERILNDDGSYYDESYTIVNRTYQEACKKIGFKDWSKNILQNMRMNDKKTSSYNLNTSLMLEWAPIKNLKISTQGTYETGRDEATDYYSPEHYYVRNLVNKFTEVELSNGYPIAVIENHLPTEGGIKDIENTTLTTYSWRNQASYEFNANNFNTRIMGGNDVYSLEGNIYGNRLWGYNDDYLTQSTVNLTELNTGVTGYNGKRQRLNYNPTLSATLERYVSWFGTMSVEYNNLYNIFGSVRLDQTNLLVNANKFRNNPSWSVGAKWFLTNETFFTKPKALDNLSVRFSYGLSGNIDKTTTPDITGSFGKEYNVTSLNILTITNPANPSLGWEKTYTTNLGFDASLFNYGLNVTLDLYGRKSTDLLCTIKNDATTGWGSLRTNAASMTNRGFEIMLQGAIIRSKDIGWNASLNFAYNHSNVTDYKYESSALSAIYGNPIEGRPLYQLTAIRYGGLDENGEPTFLKKNDDTKYSYSELKTVTKEDLIDEGQTNPPVFGSFNTSLRWKAVTFNMVLTYQLGHKMRLPSPYVSGGLYTKWSGEKYRWIEGADNSNKWVPRLYNGYGGNTWAPSTYWDCLIYSDKMVDNADVIRLKSIGVSYDLTRWLKTIHVAGGSVGVSGENLWFWAANREHLDPDIVNEDFFGYTTTLATSARVVLNLTINF
ncbi:MAG: SusC/RagA family TonB-linked outer membrane protein [Bacteroidales bacterium]|nr:SusC/RagA family TonB-linked outer membrane protein [Bacteroidales bacterium]HPD96486.1 SusC/RagA family TonB-linked outer membrane protein [Tenuifilaceae bacterium]HRX30404.1 SusC/RagA family TonB-linked outer membrane protein [Tenuifilaceae bacterium]